jgi:hypothetical protein
MRVGDTAGRRKFPCMEWGVTHGPCGTPAPTSAAASAIAACASAVFDHARELDAELGTRAKMRSATPSSVVSKPRQEPSDEITTVDPEQFGREQLALFLGVRMLGVTVLHRSSVCGLVRRASGEPWACLRARRLGQRGGRISAEGAPRRRRDRRSFPLTRLRPTGDTIVYVTTTRLSKRFP